MNVELFFKTLIQIIEARENVKIEYKIRKKDIGGAESGIFVCRQ